jgi:glycosyltransferase involved in cell wall biosynthesis
MSQALRQPQEELCKFPRMTGSRKKTIAICSNYAWTVYNFRLPLIRALKANGFRVLVVTQFDGYEDHLRSEADVVKHLFISRDGMNPVTDLGTAVHLLFYFIIYRPRVALLFSVKPVLYGSLAAELSRIKVVAMITGLGTAFISESAVTVLVKKLYKICLRRVHRVFFQNTDDMNLFIRDGLINEGKCGLTPGSGVDLTHFCHAEYPSMGEIKFLFVGRMITDKGLIEFIEAARRIKSDYPATRFQLLGPSEVENKTAVGAEQIQLWVSEGVVEYLGSTDDVRPFLEAASCVVLPSYREGTSKALLEAAAVGRPLITCDVPGCREVVDVGISGFLCEPRNASDLALQMQRFLGLTHEQKLHMGQNGRRKIENAFSDQVVVDCYLNAIESVLK